MAKMVDEATRNVVGNIPLCRTKAGPRDEEAWRQRLKEEFLSLMDLINKGKEADNDWFRYT